MMRAAKLEFKTLELAEVEVGIEFLMIATGWRKLVIMPLEDDPASDSGHPKW
jgi:hypothetical protein